MCPCPSDVPAETLPTCHFHPCCTNLPPSRDCQPLVFSIRGNPSTPVSQGRTAPRSGSDTPGSTAPPHRCPWETSGSEAVPARGPTTAPPSAKPDAPLPPALPPHPAGLMLLQQLPLPPLRPMWPRKPYRAGQRGKINGHGGVDTECHPSVGILSPAKTPRTVDAEYLLHARHCNGH